MNPHPPLRLAVVGCGVIGRLHAELAAHSPDLHVAALIDPSSAATTAVAEHLHRLGAPPPRVHTDLTTALADGGIDIVVICTLSGTHAQLGLEALEAGLHVVIEKPLDVDVAAARHLRDAAAQRPGQVIAVISQHRHDPSARAVRRALDARRFGRITSAVANTDWFRSQEYYDSAAWRGTWALDGGALMNQGVHTLDLLLWFLGEPVDVTAHTARLAHERIEVEDVAVAILRFEDGALATLHATTAAYPDLGVRLQIHGTDGSAVIARDELTFFHTRDAEDIDGDQVTRELAELNGGPGNSHQAQWTDIVTAIREGRTPLVDVDAGFLALTTVRAVYLSATLGRTIRVADVADGKYDGQATRTGSQT
ncbi:Gfo/Idh/MocA family protein [Phytomonospora endophytica]|uniref:Putative dehydrogenase n=1 Tax=Phytomonospora endophytica TaxID=714109 RepID=A0A841FWG7_9ACTN|nr:Gfo/Idh/MocA family oxidoreductase [Phytomonospora endophytica]MBB6037882.1 putative dehydrogenase [Phytomonospora endophytica]GIG68781.1 oxidoreductase [Phytomonospora endophytica]